MGGDQAPGRGQGPHQGGAHLVTDVHRGGAGAAAEAVHGDVVRLQGQGRGHVRRHPVGGDLDAHGPAREPLPDLRDALAQGPGGIQVREARRGVGGGSGSQTPDLGDLVGHLGGRQLAAQAGLGRLAQLDLEGVSTGHRRLVPAEVAARHLQDVGLRRVALGGQHAALAGAHRHTRLGRAPGQGDLGLPRQRPEGHVGDEGRQGQRQGPSGPGAQGGRGVDRLLRQPGPTLELGGGQVEMVPG